MIVALLFGACCFLTGAAVMILTYGNLVTAHPAQDNDQQCDCERTVLSPADSPVGPPSVR